MTNLDPSHELKGRPELPDLPAPEAHHMPGWNWIFAAVIASVTTFTISIIFLAFSRSTAMTTAVAIVVFVFTFFFTHARAEKAR